MKWQDFSCSFHDSPLQSKSNVSKISKKKKKNKNCSCPTEWCEDHESRRSNINPQDETQFHVLLFVHCLLSRMMVIFFSLMTIILDLDLRGKPPHGSIRTSEPQLRGSSRLSCFQHQVCGHIEVWLSSSGHGHAAATSYLVVDPHWRAAVPVQPPAPAGRRDQQSFWGASHILSDLPTHTLLVLNVGAGFDALGTPRVWLTECVPCLLTVATLEEAQWESTRSESRTSQEGEALHVSLTPSQQAVTGKQGFEDVSRRRHFALP